MIDDADRAARRGEASCGNKMAASALNKWRRGRETRRFALGVGRYNG